MRALSSCGEWASHCGGPSSCRAWSPGTRAPAGAAHGLSSGSTQAQPPRGMWSHPELGIKPMSPALAGGLNHLTTKEVPLLLFSVT